MTDPRPVVVSAGAAEYRSLLITETKGADISADTVQMALVPVTNQAGYPAAGDWLAADRVQHSSDHAKVTASLLVDSRFAAGRYVLWAKITDTPEIAALKDEDNVEVVVA